MYRDKLPKRPRRPRKPKQYTIRQPPQRSPIIHEPIDDPTGLVLSAILPIVLTNGNDGQQKNWQSTANARKHFQAMFRMWGIKRFPFDFPTRVIWTRILGPHERAWDYTSILRGNAKQIEDALVDMGWWHDDGPEYITQAIGAQIVDRRQDGPALKIDIYRS